MKIILTILMIFVSVYITGCNNSSVTDPNSGIGGPGGPGGNTVNFTIQGTGNNQNFNFQFKPGEDVKLNYLVATLPAQQFTDSVPNPDPNFVFSAAQFHGWYAYTGVQSGQQWTFRFGGTTVSGSQAFTSSVNFTVQ
jgi:hypothetical protein